MLFFCLFIMLNFQNESSVKLNIPLPTTHPSIAIDTNRNIWCTSYWDDVVYKLNSEGSLIYKIGGRRGYGPGEIAKPLSILLFEDSNTVVVHGAGMRLSTFNMETGTFIEFLDDKTPFIKIFPWDKTSFIGYTDPTNEKGGFSLIGLSGNKKDQWFTQDNFLKITNGYFPYAKGSSDIVYFQDGVKPEVYIIRKTKQNYSTWELNLPLNYVAPPKKPIKREHMFNKGKLEEFYNSFSFIHGLNVIDGKYLIVCWKIPEQEKRTYQIYDIRDKTQIIKEFYINGVLVATPKGFYSLTLKQSETDPDEEYYLLNLHKWSIGR